jgi:N-terminal acetyltransferase B complex non-catalytic subunit
VYKATNAGHAAVVDELYVLESLDRLGNAFASFLHGKTSRLTNQEHMYYEVVSQLTRFVPAAISATNSGPAVDFLTNLAAALTCSLSILHDAALSLPAKGDADPVLLMLASPHGLSYLQDAATAVRVATAHVVAFNDREKERDRSGQSNVPKEVMALVKTLDTSACEELQAGKARVVMLKAEVSKANLERRLVEWTFKSDGQGGWGLLAQDIREEVADGVSEWARAVAESWRVGVKGWEQAKWA